jgi:hypothetical protein
VCSGWEIFHTGKCDMYDETLVHRRYWGIA